MAVGKEIHSRVHDGKRESEGLGEVERREGPDAKKEILL